MLPLVLLGIIAPVLAFAGWRDARDETPRNVAAAIFFIILPFATPLAFVAYGAGLEWTFGAWLVGAAIWGLGASASARAHPLPGPGRILLLATAWILSALGGLFVLAQIGLGRLMPAARQILALLPCQSRRVCLSGGRAPWASLRGLRRPCIRSARGRHLPARGRRMAAS